MTLNGVMAVTLRYFNQFAKSAFQLITGSSSIEIIDQKSASVTHTAVKLVYVTKVTHSRVKWISPLLTCNLSFKFCFTVMMVLLLNDLLHGVGIWTDLSSVLSQSTCLTDGQTDEQTDTFLIASPPWHSMQRGNTSDNDKFIDSWTNANDNNTLSLWWQVPQYDGEVYGQWSWTVHRQ